MGFQEFRGNADVVDRLRDMVARKKFPHAVVLAGPRGSGKYTLALMMARALNCLEQPVTSQLAGEGALHGSCRISAGSVRTAFASGMRLISRRALRRRSRARENLRETDKKETRILVQTHPDVLVIPPDPPQMMIKVDQVRKVIESIYFRPQEARERVYIFTDSAFMKEAANSLLESSGRAARIRDDFSSDGECGRVVADDQSRDRRCSR